MSPASPKRAAAGAALVLSSIGLTWFLGLIAFGGFDTHVLGIRLTSNEPRKPFIAGAICLGLYLLLTRNDAAPRAATGRPRWLVSLAKSSVPLALAVAMTTVSWIYSTRAVGGSDSYGYASQAELWLHGQIAVRQPLIDLVPWPDPSGTFSPLGYMQSPLAPDVIVPTYPPGLPLLMALAKRIAGVCGVFWVVPISAGILVFASHGIGRKLGGHEVGWITSWLIATSPLVMYTSVSPMSDVPAAAAAAACFWLLGMDRATSSFLAGLAIAVAMLVRPNLAPLASLPMAWLMWKVWSMPQPTRRAAWFRLAAFAGGIAPGVIVFAIVNWKLYGSPLRSGYGGASEMFTLSHLGPNLRRYLTWFREKETILPLLSWATLAIPARWLWPSVRDRSYVVLLGLFSFMLWVLYGAFIEVDAWWYLRYVLPSWPMIMAGFAHLLWVPAVRMERWGRALVLLAAVLVGAHNIRTIKDQFILNLWKGEYKFPAAAHLVAQYTEPNSVILSQLHSGSVQYYAGRLAMRWDSLDPNWLDRAVDWLREHGAHAYLLAEDEELKQFRARFSGSALGRLEMDPYITYIATTRVRLFDLWGRNGAPILVQDSFKREGCAAPADSLSFSLAR